MSSNKGYNFSRPWWSLLYVVSLLLLKVKGLVLEAHLQCSRTTVQTKQKKANPKMQSTHIAQNLTDTK